MACSSCYVFMIAEIHPATYSSLPVTSTGLTVHHNLPLRALSGHTHLIHA